MIPEKALGPRVAESRVWRDKAEEEEEGDFTCANRRASLPCGLRYVEVPRQPHTVILFVFFYRRSSSYDLASFSIDLTSSSIETDSLLSSLTLAGDITDRMVCGLREISGTFGFFFDMTS